MKGGGGESRGGRASKEEELGEGASKGGEGEGVEGRRASRGVEGRASKGEELGEGASKGGEGI